MYHHPPIYCIMITGKNEDRYKFVDIAVRNFNEQTYENKYLLIINHGSKSLEEIVDDRIIEVRFNKTERLTLGDMRNYALDLVPLDALWTIWDDDDWRHSRYIELMYKNMKDHKADVVFIKNRLEYNLSNGFVYRARFEKGMPFVLAKKNEVIRYLQKDSLEDIRLLNDFELHSKKIYLISNDPRWYIRTLHGQNTSLYVDGNKSAIIQYGEGSSYQEFDATSGERAYTQKIIERYFGTFTTPNDHPRN